MKGRTDFGDQVDTAVKNMVNEGPVGHHVWRVCRQEMGMSVRDSEVGSGLKVSAAVSDQ